MHQLGLWLAAGHDTWSRERGAEASHHQNLPPRRVATRRVATRRDAQHALDLAPLPAMGECRSTLQALPEVSVMFGCGGSGI